MRLKIFIVHIVSERFSNRKKKFMSDNRVGIKSLHFVKHESISLSNKPKICETSIFHKLFYLKYDNFKNSQNRQYLFVYLSRIKWVRLTDERTKFCKLIRYRLKLKIMSFFHEAIFFLFQPRKQSFKRLEEKLKQILKKNDFLLKIKACHIYIYILLTVFYRKAYLFKVFQDFFCNIIEITFWFVRKCHPFCNNVFWIETVASAYICH